MKQQIFDELVKYLGGTDKSPQGITAPKLPLSDSKCEAILATGSNKSSKCPKKSKGQHPFLSLIQKSNRGSQRWCCTKVKAL